MKTLQHKRGTAAILTANNPILNEGEIGIETDTKKFKIGDGSTAWASLSYASDVISNYAATTNFPATGTDNVIYIATDSGRTYRWTGSQYVEIGPPTTTLSATDPTVGLTLLHPFLLGGM